MFKTGYRRGLTFFLVWSSLPIIKWGKKLSGVPVLKWIIAPFFRYPHNEVTAVPVNVEVARPESAVLPRSLLTRMLAEIDDIFLLQQCVCRKLHPVEGYPTDVGCMALGPASRMIHPTHGRRVTSEEAAAHVRRQFRHRGAHPLDQIGLDAAAGNRSGKQSIVAHCEHGAHRARG